MSAYASAIIGPPVFRVRCPAGASGERRVLSAHIGAAADAEDFTRDVGGIVTGQEQREVGDVGGLAQPPQRRFCLALLEEVGRVDAREELVVDQARGDGVGADAVPAALRRHRAGEGHHARLGCAIVRLAGVGGDPPRHRGHAHDDAAALRDHVGQDRARDPEGAGQADAEHEVPRLVRHLPDGLELVDAGVVEEDVDPPEALQGGAHHRLHLVLLRDVDPEGRVGRPYSALILAATSWARRAWASETTTWAPSSAKRRATACPIPAPAAAVTIATRSWSFMGFTSLSTLRREDSSGRREDAFRALSGCGGRPGRGPRYGTAEGGIALEGRHDAIVLLRPAHADPLLVRELPEELPRQRAGALAARPPEPVPLSPSAGRHRNGVVTFPYS